MVVGGRQRSPRGEAGRDSNPSDPDASPRSRTEQTRAATAINKLGQQLAALSERDLDRLRLPERLREEIDVWGRLKPRTRGRQSRLIGQLLRAEDHEAIRERFEALERDRRLDVQRERLNERWLERLIEEGDSAVEALMTEHPGADRQRMRLLSRSVRKDAGSKKAKRARRELLRAIRVLRGVGEAGDSERTEA